MPEGHTLHRLARELSTAFGGRVVRVGSPQGRFADSAALLDGAVLVGAEAWGKHLFVELAGDRFVHVHLGLYGKFAVHTGVAEVPPPVGQVRLRLVAADSGDAYADLRGATTCELVTPDQRDAVVARSGPDPLRPDADPTRAWRADPAQPGPDRRPADGPDGARRCGQRVPRRGAVPAPDAPAAARQDARAGQFRAIWDDLVELMAEGVRTGRIDTVRPEHTPEAMGRPARVDDHGGEVYVYRRTGQACHVCGATVRTEALLGRNLFWCPQCQRRFRSRAVE